MGGFFVSLFQLDTYKHGRKHKLNKQRRLMTVQMSPGCNAQFPVYNNLSLAQFKLFDDWGRFSFVRTGRPKRTGSGQFEWKGPRRMRTFFPQKLSKLPRVYRPEQAILFFNAHFKMVDCLSVNYIIRTIYGYLWLSVVSAG